MCKYDICCYYFCCQDGKRGGIKAIQEKKKDYFVNIADFSFNLAIKLAKDFFQEQENFRKIKKEIDDCIEKGDIAKVLEFIHKEQQWINPCCKL